MSYSYRGNSFVSHLQNGREYKFANADSKRAALAQMLEDDQRVREAAQQRASDAGVKKPLSDRDIAQGNVIPDRSTTVEKIAAEALARGAKHDPFAVGADTVRSQMRSTDSASVREANLATIERLEARSAELAQQRAAMPPAVEPTGPEATASALRLAAEQLKPLSPLGADQAQYAERKRRLLEQADAQDAKAVAESERAAKAKANEAWVVDADATLFLISTDPSIPQETVNAVRDFRQRLVNCEATGTEWIEFANGVDAQRKQIRADKIAEKNAEIANLEQQKTAIRAGTDTTPPAEPPAPEA